MSLRQVGHIAAALAYVADSQHEAMAVLEINPSTLPSSPSCSLLGCVASGTASCGMGWAPGTPAHGDRRGQARPDLIKTGEQVRTVLSDRPAISGVVLLDGDGRPRYTLDRNRFLLEAGGAFGHALFVKREAAQLGDEPRGLDSSSSALVALELVRSSLAHRRYDDIVGLDSAGRCAGTVCVGDVVQGVAKMNIEQAAALHPLTRLPGSDLVAELVDRKVADGDTFAVSWLDADDFAAVNDRGGFTPDRHWGHRPPGSVPSSPRSSSPGWRNLIEQARRDPARATNRCVT